MSAKKIVLICLIAILLIGLLLSVFRVPLSPQPIESQKTISFLILDNASIKDIEAMILKDPESVNGRQLPHMPLPPAFENPLACAVVHDRKDVVILLMSKGASVQKARKVLMQNDEDIRKLDVWTNEFKKEQ